MAGGTGQQGSVSRGLHDARSKLKSLSFWIAEITVGPLCGIWAVSRAPNDASNTLTAIYGFGGGLAAIFLFAGLIVVWSVFRAPYKQRDEWRQQLIEAECAEAPVTHNPILQAKIERVRRWQEQIAAHQLALNDGNSAGALYSQDWYQEMRPHLRKEIRSDIESGVRSGPRVRVGHCETDMDKMRAELARIEKDWGLL